MMRVSLRDAARLSGIPEEAIRRKILTGEIASVPVDDDRQYFVRLEDLGVATPPECGPRPKSCSPFFAPTSTTSEWLYPKPRSGA